MAISIAALLQTTVEEIRIHSKDLLFLEGISVDR